jgi:GNAT superfamily N-acetyltransferase
MNDPALASPVRIRLARPGEAPALGALCVRSKAHWGYDAAFMRLSYRSLQIDPAAIDAGRVFVAADERDAPLGVADCCALPEPGAFDLLHLFVDPRALRRGVGRTLFEAACTWCVAQGATRLVILSEPNAAAFYQRLGARLIGQAPSDAVPGRLSCRCSSIGWRAEAPTTRQLRHVDQDLHLQELREEQLQRVPEHPQQRQQHQQGRDCREDSPDEEHRQLGERHIEVDDGGGARRRHLDLGLPVQHGLGPRRRLSFASLALARLAFTGLPVARIPLAADRARQIVVGGHGKCGFRHAEQLPRHEFLARFLVR